MLTPPNKPSDLAASSEQLELFALRERYNHLLLTNINASNQTGQDKNNELALHKVWEDTESLPKLYEQLTDLKKCLDSLRPLSTAQLHNLNESFDIEYTYESNRIEGNTLTMQETHLVVNKGLTVKGKSMVEHLEAVNHQEAIDYIRDIASKEIPLDKRTLLDIHSLVLHGIDRENGGKYRQEDVMISGSSFKPPMFLQVPQLMEDFFAFYQASKDRMHPVALASELHERLVTIHPFTDGNGRTARLLMNLILIRHGYPMTILSSDNDKRHQYYDSLAATQTGKDPDKAQFKRFIAQNVKAWCFHYLNLLAPNGTPESKQKGYYFFKRIEDLL